MWRAHRSHFYQRATQAGSSHAEVSTAVLTNNLGLIAICALVGIDHPWIGILAAGFLVASLLRRLSQ